MPSNRYEQQFLNALRDIFVGAKVEGDSGYINLMKIKSRYYTQGVFPRLTADIDKACKPFDPAFREELYEKLHDFFKAYFSESGSIYFRRTPGHQNVYDKVYTDDRDVILFWKTHMLYYVKTDRLFNSLEVEVDGQTFFFDVSAMELKRSNEKRELTYTFKALREGKIILAVAYSERGRKTKTEDILKAARTHGLDLTEESLERACRVFEKQSEVDYFINKDAGAFLREQFDLWLYQYVFSGQNAFTETRLKQLQAIKDIAFKIIDFIAQFEDELARVWNKPRFVLNSHYVLTLDKIIDPALLGKILAHSNFPSQLQEWRDLGMLDDQFKLEMLSEKDQNGAPLHPRFQFLPIDTKYFPDLELEILALFEDLDAALDGWLIHSENYQALNTLLPKFREGVKTIYIDPPYNTAASEIIYENRYKHSSWISLIRDRLSLSKSFLDSDKGFICCTIDDVEQKTLSQLIESEFGEIAGVVSIRIKPSGRPIPNGFAISHEYAVFARMNLKNPVSRFPHSEEQNIRYREQDEIGPFFWELLRKAGSNSSRTARPTMYFPFIVNAKTLEIRLPKMEFDQSTQSYLLREPLTQDEVEVYPIRDDKSDGVWYFGYEKVKTIVHELKAEKQIGQYRIYYRRRPNEGQQPTTIWTESKYSATEHGTALIKNLFGETELFSYPKSIHAVVDCLIVSGAIDSVEGVFLDYFAGSGTTAHAVMNLNRADGGHRKYILVEMGEHFNTVILPRVKKVAFSDQWRDGKAILPPPSRGEPEGGQTSPEGGHGLSHFVKYYDLEQYEDTLRRARYEDSDLLKGADPYSSYVFLRDLKLLDAVSLDFEADRADLHLESLYPGIDLAETLSCISGKWIKRITPEQVEFADGTSASLSHPDWSLIKPLLWW